MNIYKTALSALVLAPIVGGVGIHMFHNYQRLKEDAEALNAQSQMSMETIETMLDGETEEPVRMDAVSLDDAELDLAYQPDDRQGVEDAVIRFHVRANSDSEEDQALKLLIRDAVLDFLQPKLSDADSKQEARDIMEENLKEIEQISKELIQEAGYDYGVEAYLTVEEFPMKAYGDILFPAGEYEALRIDIGDKDGQNWWCVMYPGLCFADAVGGVVSDDGKEALQEVLTPEEYENLLIAPPEDMQVEYKSLLWETLFGWD